jgi:hypothetical protein
MTMRTEARLLFIIFNYLLGQSGTKSTITDAFIGLLYQPRIIDSDDCGAISGLNEWQGKPKYSDETCSSAALSTTDPTWYDPGWNPGRHGGKSASNRVSYASPDVWRYQGNEKYKVPFL